MTASKPASAPKMTVPFYGHARQYRSIKSEIDEAFHAVIESESYVMGPTLERFEGRVSDSGEGRWTMKAAIDEGVPVPTLNAALSERFASRGNAEFANKVLSAMRFEFGGHVEKNG